MVDYKGLEALTAIIQYQSFELAADKLNISQSAVSQRLKALQNQFNDPILIRSIPYRPTALGEYLLGHFKRVNLLESHLESQIQEQKMQVKISIAISRDSLETWFMSLIESSNLFKDKILEIIADDQDITLEYFQKGLVSACFTTSEKNLSNCSSVFLGYLDYLLVCSPDFKRKYFSSNKHKENLSKAPGVIFDKNDHLHENYLAKFFNIKFGDTIYHVMPSVAGFKNLVLGGYAYTLIPEIDIREHLKNKTLTHLFKDKIWRMPVYLHHWNIDSKEYQDFFQRLIMAAKAHLKN